MKKMKQNPRIGLLTAAVISSIFAIWAGFTGREGIFPFLLSLTLLFSISGVILDNRKVKGFKVYVFTLAIALFSVVLGFTFLLIR